MKTDGKNNKFSKHMNTALIDPMRIAYIIKNRLLELYNPYYQAELGKSHEKFGKITFLRGAFNDIPLEGNKIDLIVSISAFEHNNYDDMPNSIVEFLRVLKKNASMIITTSAAHEKDWYHTPSKGWNLTLQTLSKWFGIADNHSFDYESTSNRIKNCEKLKKRIPDYYKYTAESGLPYADLKNAEYIPVGVIKRKAVLT
jgi:ubiquinone/menaquinone biosynthesis C-methylase UbiE